MSAERATSHVDADASADRIRRDHPGGKIQLTPASSRHSRLEASFLRKLLQRVGNPPLTVRLWDGHEIRPPEDASVASVAFADRAMLWKVVADPLYQFCQGYVSGRIMVEGDFIALMEVLLQSMNRASGQPSWSSRIARRLAPRQSNRLSKSRDNIHHHYDIGNDFYQRWLDEKMVYTCAYFERPEMTLEAAQAAKMDYVCRKLWLQPGDEVVEAGSGWGALTIHMAKHYGVRVKAYNISREQVAYSRQTAAAEGLEQRVEFIEDDWRNIYGDCDAFVSIGMLEHLGPENYGPLGCVIDRCLRPHGRGLLHFIGQNFSQPMNPWFERHIFPGAHLPSITEAAGLLEAHDMSVMDIENLRLHYAATLREWLRRFEASRDWVHDRYGEEFVRTWRMYLVGSIAGFESGSTQLFQMLFARGATNEIPLTRSRLTAAANEQQRQ